MFVTGKRFAIIQERIGYIVRYKETEKYRSVQRPMYESSKISFHRDTSLRENEK